jgi:cyclopropane fatty-acyl-phospholipid synthase-like methyltransferase
MRDEKACGLVQMEYTVPPEVLYSAYWYRSGTNNTMRCHLQDIVGEAMEMTDLKESATVLDIGCNDGTLLSFYPDSFTKFGVDPSDVAQEIKAHVNVIQDIFPSEELISKINNRKFDIITSIAMYYDLEDPVAFTCGIKKILSPEGIWIFEMSYMPTMLKMTSYDTICHEHIEYYSLAVIEYILKQAGMKVVKVSHNDSNGGSLRCHATHISNFTYKRADFQQNIKAMRKEEFDLEIDTDKPYRHFQERVNVHREELNSLLKKLKNERKKIHIYGASTKGNTILQWCGIDHRIIDCAAERNPDKYGAVTLGTDIPIVSEKDSRAMNPDYYLVLPWHFKEEFLKREAESLELGIGFIFPLPTIEIIHK